ncbi:MAG: ribosome maturation factor RimM [Aquimonas sp.]|nr:ribosome maturation factor RimM [Aquimonas sp.]
MSGALPPAAEPNERRVLMGRVVGAFGVRGWLKIESYSNPRGQIFRYRPWLMGREGQLQEIQPLDLREQGRGVVVQLPGCDSPESAELRLGQEIWVRRGSLPPPSPGEYYWVDLEGLQVVTVEGVDLGRISHMVATGANDVMVIRGDRERLVPFTPGHALVSVDLASGQVVVDWDPEF